MANSTARHAPWHNSSKRTSPVALRITSDIRGSPKAAYQHLRLRKGAWLRRSFTLSTLNHQPPRIRLLIEKVSDRLSPMPKKPKLPMPIEQINDMIRTIRGTRVMLDGNLAKIYGVPTKVFNQAVKRNRQRFPRGFHVSADLGRSQGTPGFMVTNCDLETRPKYQISAPRIHRIRCVDGRQYPEQRTGCSDEHFCRARVCENARSASRHSRAGAEAR